MCHLRMAVMHLPKKFCANSSIQFGVIDIFRNQRWRPPPSWIFSLCEFGHSGVLTVWYLCSVPNLVHRYQWDRRTYASDLHLMTSRELTSGFDLATWSSPHGRDASSHNVWCRYLYPIRSYFYFSKIKDGGRRHLGFVWVSHGTTHEASFMVRSSCKDFVMIG